MSEAKAGATSAEQFHKSSGIPIALYAMLDKVGEFDWTRPPRSEEVLASIYGFAEAYAAECVRGAVAPLEIKIAQLERDAVDVDNELSEAKERAWKAEAAVAQETNRLQAVIERERTAIAAGVTGLKKAIREREWLGEGRGPFEWDDDRWHDEFNFAAKEILAALEPLERIAVDMSNSPKTQELVDAARRSPEIEAALAQERERKRKGR